MAAEDIAIEQPSMASFTSGIRATNSVRPHAMILYTACRKARSSLEPIGLNADGVDHQRVAFIMALAIQMPMTRTRSASPCVVTSLVVWCAYSASRSVWLPGDGKVPSPVNGHEAEREAKERARDRHCNGGKIQHVADHHHGGTG